MNLQEFDGRNTAWALYAARLCGRAYTPQVQDGLAAALEQVCGLGVEVGFRLVENGVPAVIRGVGPEGLCVVVSGITGLSQASSIKTGYERLLVNTSTGHFNEYFWQSAIQLIRQLRLDGHAPNRDVFIFGHSGGGGVAVALGAILRPLNPRYDVHVVTFGEPRPCTENAFLSLAGVNITRWMNVGDDVPRLPPRLLDLTDLSFLAVVEKLPLWYRFVHPFGGLILDNLGGVQPGESSPRTRLLSVLSFPVNLFLTGNIFSGDHSIAEYARRLSLGLPPKIPGVIPTLKGAFDVGSLPIMFQVLTSDIPMSLPIPIQGGVERVIKPDVVELEIFRREAFINAPLKRC